MRRLLPIVVLFCIALGVVIAIREADPAMQHARASRAEALAAREWAKTQRAQAAADAAIRLSNEISDASQMLADALVLSSLALLAIGIVVASGVGVALIVYVNLRAQIAGRMLHADKRGIYPVVREPGGGWVALNEPRAQTLAAMVAASAHRPSAAAVRRVLDGAQQDDQPRITDNPRPDAESAVWPNLVEVYSAPLSRQLALPVGVDGAGRQISLPLHNLGNVLVGGLPGTGKSELLAAMIAGLLRQDASGRSLQVAVVDPKLVDFGNIPADLAALWRPVATDLSEAYDMLSALQDEVQHRFDAMHRAGARSLEELNAAGDSSRLPYLVLLVDELADMTCDVRERAIRFVHAAMEIGRKGRAAGVSLVMATQRPSTDVIPASLRNLAGAAVAFRVSRLHDSIAILGAPGAEALPALPGRCLVRYGKMTVCQAYSGGLASRSFDTFLAALPRSSANVTGGANAQRNEITDTGTPEETGIGGIFGTDGTGTYGIGTPVFSDNERGEYTPEQITYIRMLYERYGSIKAVERVLYNQNGGYWFYRIKEVVQGEYN